MKAKYHTAHRTQSTHRPHPREGNDRPVVSFARKDSVEENLLVDHVCMHAWTACMHRAVCLQLTELRASPYRWLKSQVRADRRTPDILFGRTPTEQEQEASSPQLTAVVVGEASLRVYTYKVSKSMNTDIYSTYLNPPAAWLPCTTRTALPHTPQNVAAMKAKISKEHYWL